MLDPESPKAVGIFMGHRDGITYLDLKGDGRHFISNSKDQTIKLWDMRKFSSTKEENRTRESLSAPDWDYRWQPVPKQCEFQIKHVLNMFETIQNITILNSQMPRYMGQTIVQFFSVLLKVFFF